VGLKLFQSAQPAFETTKFPSASSKPAASAIEPPTPQPVAASSRAAADEPLFEFQRSEE
jgi:hypothetical protein